MANSKFFIMSIVLILFIAVEFGSSLNCYNCTEVTNKHCKDTFNKEHVSQIQCLNSQVCIKHKRPGITVDTTGNNSKNLTANIVRGCKPKDYCKNVANFAVHCSDCSTDLCNSSSGITSSFIIIALFVAKNILY